MEEQRKRLLTPKEAAEYLGVSLATLNRIDEEGKLVSYRPRGHRRYSLTMLDEYLEKSHIPVSSEDPIEVLGLSVRSFNALMHASIRTIGELVQIVESGNLREVRGIGPKSLPEIENSLTRVRLVDAPEPVDESDTPFPDGTPTQASASTTHLTPLDVLGLSLRTYNALERRDITTVEQLATMSLSEILSVPRIGYDRLAKIKRKLKAYLAEHPLPDEAQQSPPELEAQMVEPPPLQLPSSPLDPTPLDVLGLSLRPYNALERRDITTVAQLAIMSNEEIRGVRNIGPKSLAEIQEKLRDYLSANRALARSLPKTSALSELDIPPWLQEKLRAAGIRSIEEVVSHSEEELLEKLPISYHQMGLLFLKRGLSQRGLALATKPPFQTVEVKVPVISKEIIEWQAGLVKKQISAGLLHEQARIAGNSIAYWLSSVNKIVDHHHAYETMASILGASINICEELAFLFDHIQRQDHTAVLLSRYGSSPKTLKEIGSEIGITRERVRQISNKAKRTIGTRVSSIVRATSVSDLVRKPTLLRIQSALLAAKDMGMDITHEEWEQGIRSSGLVGIWTSQDYMAIDPVEALVAVCNLLADDEISELGVPDNLKYAIELAIRGKPDLPAIVLQAFSERMHKLIKRHTRFSGGVNARWLSKEIEEDIAVVEGILRALGYTEASKDWFIKGVGTSKYKISYHDSFHHALLKMSQYCGPLLVDEICSGTRYNASRTKFPIPPPDVMEQMLRTHGYSNEGGLYYWDGEVDEELSAGEIVIMNCLAQNGPVVHHAELAQAFIDSELSFASLHPTLQRSPLFKRMETGLYKLRGRSVTRQDIERAEAAEERISVNLEVEYNKRGNIIISATLSVIAVGTSAIFCEQFPNLSGEWDCIVNGKRSGKLYATENEFRRLKKPFEFLSCEAEDRLRFTFNTWNRTVIIEKAGK